MKKTATLLLSLVFVLSLVVSAYASTVKPDYPIIGNYYPGTQVQMEPGDIVVTNNTSSGGLTGHAGMEL